MPRKKVGTTLYEWGQHPGYPDPWDADIEEYVPYDPDGKGDQQYKAGMRGDATIHKANKVCHFKGSQGGWMGCGKKWRGWRFKYRSPIVRRDWGQDEEGLWQEECDDCMDAFATAFRAKSFSTAVAKVQKVATTPIQREQFDD